MHLFIYALILGPFIALGQENSSDEKIKIDLKIEMPKNSLLNLIIKASSGEAAECGKKNSSHGTKVDQNHFTTNANQILTHSELNITNAYTTTKSVLFVRKLVKFCALDTFENSSIPSRTFVPSSDFSTSISSTTTGYVEDVQTNQLVEDKLLPHTTTNIVIMEKKLCPENFRNYGDRCIYVSAEFKSWFDAKLQCQELQSRLISPDTTFTFERVLLPIAYELNQDFWINAYFNMEFDEWLYPLNGVEIPAMDANQTNVLAFEKTLNNQMIYIDPNEHKEWFCNPDKLKAYSSLSQEPMENYLAMSWSEEFGRNCIDNFNLNANKRVVCELA